MTELTIETLAKALDADPDADERVMSFHEIAHLLTMIVSGESANHILEEHGIGGASYE